MKLLYFAWVREKIGRHDEVRRRPDNVRTVGELLDWLARQGAGYNAALARRDALRIAVNGEIVTTEQTLEDDDEVAIFPPVTGGGI